MNWWLRTSWSSVVCPPCHYLCSRQMKNRSKNKKTTRSERRKFRRKGDFQGDSRNSERKEIDHKVRPNGGSDISFFGGRIFPPKYHNHNSHTKTNDIAPTMTAAAAALRRSSEATTPMILHIWRALSIAY